MNYLELLTEEYFAKGMDPESYAADLRSYRSIVKKLLQTARGRAEDEQVTLLREKAAAQVQPVRATVNTEDWCGDSACTIPILADLFGRADIPLRIFRGSEHHRLMNRYKKDGDTHIPVVSIWDGEGREIARWIEAPKKVDEMKSQWKGENPRMMELYEKKQDDKEAAKEFARIYRNFLLTMAGWYEEGMWAETTAEILAALDRGRGRFRG
jgi:hypothetical protein